MRRSLPILTSAALLALTGCGAAAVGASQPSRPAVAVAAVTSTTEATLTTTGTGTVSATPDVMTVQIGVQNTAPHVASALRANNAIAAAVQTALVRHGVAVTDIQTDQLSLYPQQGRNQVTGYQVSDIVTATIHNLSTAGTVLDDALAAAGDAGTLDGVSFSVADDRALLTRARQRAVTAALAAAQQIAGAAKLRLVGLRSIVDQTNQTGDYSQSMSSTDSASTAGGARVPVPVQAGTQQTTAQVTAVWTLSR